MLFCLNPPVMKQVLFIQSEVGRKLSKRHVLFSVELVHVQGKGTLHLL
jgi:hypothetical protein